MPDPDSTSNPTRPTPETKQGESYRKWRPIFLTQDGMLSLPYDWICPVCDDYIYMPYSGRGICPRCGLVVGVNPAAPKPEHIRMRQWRKFGRRC